MATLAPTAEDTRIYECAILVPASLSEKEYKETLKNVEDFFTEKGATLLHKDEWGRRGLAYRIKGHTEGQYIVYHYEMKPLGLKELDHSLRLEKGVLRHLLIRVPDGYEVLDYSKRFDEWKQEKDQEEEALAQKKEEELKKKIVKRATKKAPAPVQKEPTKDAHAEEGTGKLEDKLEELISDEDLNL
jgi:small subunit ribosomal protein S6